MLFRSVVGEDEVRSEYPDNVAVADLPRFSQAGDELYRSFEASGASLLRAIALGLGLPEGRWITAALSIMLLLSLVTIYNRARLALRESRS